jgi:hypothetical protein
MKLGEWVLLGYFLLCVILPVILAWFDNRANKRANEIEEERP